MTQGCRDYLILVFQCYCKSMSLGALGTNQAPVGVHIWKLEDGCWSQEAEQYDMDSAEIYMLKSAYGFVVLVDADGHVLFVKCENAEQLAFAGEAMIALVTTDGVGMLKEIGRLMSE